MNIFAFKYFLIRLGKLKWFASFSLNDFNTCVYNTCNSNAKLYFTIFCKDFVVVVICILRAPKTLTIL